MTDKIFASGVWYKAPRDGAPSFVKGSLSIKVADIVPFLEQHQNKGGYVNLNIKESREAGKFYIELDTWKPSEKKETPKSTLTSVQPDGSPPIDLGDSPF